MPTASSEDLLRRCRDLGFALAGIAPAEPTRYGRELAAWLAAGKHGEMGYLAQHTPQRLDPRVMVPGARSVICVADRYHDGVGTAGPHRPVRAG